MKAVGLDPPLLRGQTRIACRQARSILTFAAINLKRQCLSGVRSKRLRVDDQNANLFDERLCELRSPVEITGMSSLQQFGCNQVM